MTDSSSAAPVKADKPVNRLEILDGWRGLSILFVMASHMLPLGPKVWELNVAAGSIGMSLFFTLSGFLITSTLQRNAASGSQYQLVTNPVTRFCKGLYCRYAGQCHCR
ncbi:MAG: acyltransferase, partial [Proteobacteria bacterium]